MKRAILLTALVGLLAGSVHLLSCRRDNAGATATQGGTPVMISNYSFNSASLTVNAGITVTWTNNDNTTHTVTADDGSFTSADLNHGDTYSHTFNTAGAVHYHCKYHTMMVAVVTVQ